MTSTNAECPRCGDDWAGDNVICPRCQWGYHPATLDTAKSLTLARLWVALNECRATIHNHLLPSLHFLGSEDSDLMESLECAAEQIDNHLRSHGLIARQK